MSKLLKKLRSLRGMTMMELLLAVAVLLIICAGMALVLPASLNTYKEVTTGSEAAVLCSTLSEALSEELRFASNVQSASVSGSIGDFTYDSQRFGRTMCICLNTDDQIVLRSKDTAPDGTPQYFLVNEKNYIDGLYVESCTIHYDATAKLFTYALRVENKTTEQYVRMPSEDGEFIRVKPVNAK